MNTIWYLSKKHNLMITGFNGVEKNGVYELWVTETNGKSRKLAEGKQAKELENALLDMVWGNFPSIISDGRGKFASNINTTNEEVE